MVLTSSNKKSEITLIADPKVLAIPIQENHEDMIDIKGQTIIKIGPSPEVLHNTDYTKMRKTVYDKLVQAQSLLPEGLQFCLYEGYRSLSLQEKIFQERYKSFRKNHRDWTDGQVFVEATRLVSPVTNLDGSKNVPPHSTGGAVDVYLLDTKAYPIDMGIHPSDWMNDPDGYLSQTDSQAISAKGRLNRQMMSQALSQVGFANYPTEYWHWSYGDRYWAYQTGSTFAIYGSQ